MKQFRTHKGEIITGDKLKEVLSFVADHYKENAYAIRKENSYANHVTEETKELILQRNLDLAERIREGKENGFWLWQRINTKLTGECIAFLP